MATFDLGRVTPLYKGDYSASTSYELNDVVLYNGNLYWHVQATATVGILPTDTTVWKLAFADEGIRAEIRGYADDAQNSADSALASKSAAAQSASQASASESHAALSAQTAQTAETVATASAQTASTKASEASASAQAAASSAQTATDKATLASQKAVVASESATLATAKANAAATSETNAATAANTATAKASEAAASATSAQEYDESAQQSAVNAQASATNAAASEAAAKSYAEDSAAYLGAYPTDTAEGEIASFSDGADDIPLKSLVVDIEPVQDLHGYDSPWPAGGGKNLLNASANSGSSNGVSYTKNEDGTYTADGTADSTSSLVVGSVELVANTQYILSGCPSGGSGSTYNVRVRDSSYIPLGFDAGTETIITPSETKTYYYQISVVSGTSVSNLVFKPMIRLASVSDSTYAPYSNICPISGWTGANVNKSGINIWDEEWVVGTVSSAGVPYVLAGKIRSKNYIPVKQGTTLYFKGPSELRVAQYDASKTFLQYGTVTNGTMTMTDKTCYIMFAMDKADETYDNDISINYPATDTNYHPYAGGETVSIPFPTEAGTVYGGSLDVTNGVLTVTKKFIQSYNGEALPSAWISDRDAYTEGTTPTTGAEVCYDLATPITYQLTPTEVKSLLGQNNIYADTGDTTVEYRADTSAYVAKKIAEAIGALS